VSNTKKKLKALTPRRENHPRAQNKIPHQRICNISTTNGVILKILEAA